MITLKTGRGRTTTGNPRVPDVESVACPARPGPHWLTNDADGRTYCRGCRRSWRALDAEIRASVGWVARVS